MKSSQEGCNYQVDSNGVMQQEISGAQDLQREKITIDCYLFSVQSFANKQGTIQWCPIKMRIFY